MNKIDLSKEITQYGLNNFFKSHILLEFINIGKYILKKIFISVIIIKS
jgi:hypothetical protein